MELGLDEKVALVTGASRGIGAAIAAELAREGKHLCLVTRDSDKLQEVATSPSVRTHVDTLPYAADLRDPAAVDNAVTATVAPVGRLDLLVYNAGATKRAEFFNLTEEDWLKVPRLRAHDPTRLNPSAPRQRQHRQYCRHGIPRRLRGIYRRRRN